MGRNIYNQPHYVFYYIYFVYYYLCDDKRYYSNYDYIVCYRV